MLILSLRTDQPEAGIGIFEDHHQLAYDRWLADRQLSSTIHQQIIKLLSKHKRTLKDIDALLIYSGPGSFTGLRIGHSVANGLAYALKVPIVGSSGDDWLKIGIERLVKGDDEKIALPIYGAPPNITKPKK